MNDVKDLPKIIKKDILLSLYTTFKIGGPAKFFCIAKNIEEIKEALEFARKNNLKIFILGGGGNLLVSDKGFSGLVIKIQNSKFKTCPREASGIQDSNIICGAGLALAKAVSESVKNGLAGLEWAAGIPGTVGGAICNNSGAFGGSMADIVENVEILDIGCLSSTMIGDWKLKTTPQPPLSGGEIRISPLIRGGRGVEELENLEITKFTNKQCQFSYRSSVFKEEKKRIIISAVLKLKKGNQEESRKVISGYLKRRSEKQPLGHPSAGSVFKNPNINAKHLAELIKKYPELETITRNNTIPAGWFIEEIGLKGKKIGGAMVSDKHANFIVNAGGAKAEDVVILISLIKQKVRNNFGIQLNEEIEYVGF